MDGKIVNIAGYRFVDLPDRDELRQPFHDICSKLNLKGTILLSHEGINFFLAGLHESIDSYIDYIEQDSRFRDITLKQSITEFCNSLDGDKKAKALYNLAYTQIMHCDYEKAKTNQRRPLSYDLDNKDKKET